MGSPTRLVLGSQPPHSGVDVQALPVATLSRLGQLRAGRRRRQPALPALRAHTQLTPGGCCLDNRRWEPWSRHIWLAPLLTRRSRSLRLFLHFRETRFRFWPRDLGAQEIEVPPGRPLPAPPPLSTPSPRGLLPSSRRSPRTSLFFPRLPGGSAARRCSKRRRWERRPRRTRLEVGGWADAVAGPALPRLL